MDIVAVCWSEIRRARTLYPECDRLRRIAEVKVDGRLRTAAGIARRFSSGAWKIKFARALERMSEAQQLDTIRHEIAHVIADIEAGHGRAWQDVAVTLGAEPRDCVDSSVATYVSSRVGCRCVGCGRQYSAGPRSRVGQLIKSGRMELLKVGCCANARLVRDTSLDQKSGIVIK